MSSKTKKELEVENKQLKEVLQQAMQQAKQQAQQQVQQAQQQVQEKTPIYGRYTVTSYMEETEEVEADVIIPHESGSILFVDSDYPTLPMIILAPNTWNRIDLNAAGTREELEALDAMEEDNKMDDVPAEDYLTNEEIVEYNDGIIEGGPINNNDFDEENLPNPKEAVGFAPDSDMVAKINDVE